ncbi:MAG: LutC/YkgG family protein [Desulfomonilaceae bacterium]
MEANDLVALFCENARKVDAGVTVVDSLDEAARTIENIVKESDKVYAPRLTPRERDLKLPESLLTTDYHQATVTVEEAAAAIAETGSIVCWSKEGRPVQASVLCARHVVILGRENIFADLDAFFHRLGSDVPTNMTFITGPSRTADIELTLTTGVHGPEFVDIVIV